MPAKAGIHTSLVLQGQKTWIPAYAGMTKERVDFESTNSKQRRNSKFSSVVLS